MFISNDPDEKRRKSRLLRAHGGEFRRVGRNLRASKSLSNGASIESKIMFIKSEFEHSSPKKDPLKVVCF